MKEVEIIEALKFHDDDFNNGAACLIKTLKKKSFIIIRGEREKKNYGEEWQMILTLASARRMFHERFTPLLFRPGVN